MCEKGLWNCEGLYKGTPLWVSSALFSGDTDQGEVQSVGCTPLTTQGPGQQPSLSSRFPSTWCAAATLLGAGRTDGNKAQ